MMTCARVRVYEPGKEEKNQQKDQKDSQSFLVKVRIYVSSTYPATGRNIGNGKKTFLQELPHNVGAWLLFDGDVVTGTKSACSDGQLSLLL